jgi:hypothetical protein
MAYIGRRLRIILLSQAEMIARRKSSHGRQSNMGWPVKNCVRPQTDMGVTLVKLKRRKSFAGKNLADEQSPAVCTPKDLCIIPFSCPKTRHKLNEMTSPQIRFSVKP